MDSAELDAFIIKAVELLEGVGAAYQASFAHVGTSGLSYGFLQNDSPNNSIATAYMGKILSYGVTEGYLSVTQKKKIENFLTSQLHKPGLTQTEFVDGVGQSALDGLNETLAHDKNDVDDADIAQAQNLLNNYTTQGLLTGAYANAYGPGSLNPVAPDPFLWLSSAGGVTNLVI